MTAHEILSQIECMRPGLVEAAKAVIEAREARCDSREWPQWLREKYAVLIRRGVSRRRAACIVGVPHETAKAWARKA